MERIYTDTYDFERIRQEGGVYVDKTDRILPLVNRCDGFQFFLARPRRFGKSLLLSTIKYLFQGRRDLFEGLYIDRPEVGWDWQGETCPVLHLDMSLCVGSIEEVKSKTASQLERISEQIGVGLRDSHELEDRFSWLIEDAAAASPTGKCVLLIDEYDKPLFNYIGTSEVEPYRAFLKGFYSVVKVTERLQRFCLMTGVSKFSKVSIFSDLNNLRDLTMNRLSTTLLGYTHDEVRTNFPEALEALAQACNTDVEGAFAQLVKNYDGYCFDENMVRVFNPVSLGNALSDSNTRSYWFETGTPGWLMLYAKKHPMDVDNVVVMERLLGTFDQVEPYMTAVLFQTGYLTITDVERTDFGGPMLFTLGYPNSEVANGFNEWLAMTYVDEPAEQTSAWQLECLRAVQTGDVPRFIESLQSFFAAIGYDLTDRLTEQAYQCVVVAILRFIGIACAAEVTTSRGRIDMVCKSADHVFVIELKVASGEAASEAAAHEAIAQIRERGYAEPYHAEARMVQLVGIAFDCNIHNIAAWVCEKL